MFNCVSGQSPDNGVWEASRILRTQQEWRTGTGGFRGGNGTQRMHVGPCLPRVLNARLWNLEFSQKARDLISGLGRQGRGPSGRGQGSKQEAEEVPRPEAAGPYKNSGGQQRAGTPRAPATLLRHQWWVQLSSSEFWSHCLILRKLGTERATGTPASVLAPPLTSL